MEYFSAYKTIRNKLRRFAPRSVVECALNVLWTPHENKLKMLEQAPWQALLLVKWALIDRQASDRTGQQLSQEKFYVVRQELWAFPEKVQRAGGEPIELFMRQLTYQQIEFQRSETPIFARQPALLGALDQSHPLRRMFFEKAGLDVLDFLDLSLATYSAIVSGKRYIPFGWFDPLRKRYGTAIDAYIRAVSLNYVELLEFLRGQPDSNQRWASEFFEFTDKTLSAIPSRRHASGVASHGLQSRDRNLRSCCVKRSRRSELHEPIQQDLRRPRDRTNSANRPTVPG